MLSKSRFSKLVAFAVILLCAAGPAALLSPGVEWAGAIALGAGAFALALIGAHVGWTLHRAYRKMMALRARLRARDVRAQRRARELEQANRRFDRAFTHMRLGVAMFDRHGRIVIHNRAYADMYGFSSAQLLAGTSTDDIRRMRLENGACDASVSDAQPRRYRGQLDGEDGEIEHLRDGRHVLVTRQYLVEGGWISTHEDVTVRERAIARISHMAHHDGLTNLANRAQFVETLAALARRAAQGLGFRYAVLLLDLDQFKAVNDNYGHDAGDALLWAVAARMTQAVGDVEVVARLGGDEFAIALALGPEDADAPQRLANRLIAEIREPYAIEDRELKIGLSVGIALSSDATTDASEIMRFADMALYRAKAEGRDCHRTFQPAMEEEMRSRRSLAIDLDAALQAMSLEVHYQPVIDTASGETRAMEALARWRHPVRGYVSPASFVPIAEEAGHIQRLGEFVLARACADAKAWPDSINVAVNVSPIQIASAGFVEKARAALEFAGLPASRLELEITESVLLDDNARNLSVLHELRDMGVSIVLDDFGTGFSSLSYLNRFPFNKIKIDKTFIDGLGVHAGSAAIVSATTSIARALDAITTAEGVETEAQSDLLRAAAVTQLQGYLYGKPRPASDWVFEDGRARTRDASAPVPAAA